MNKKIDRSRVLIIGCGRLGANVANELSQQSHNVTIIDINKDAFRKLSPSFSGLYIEGDAANIELLKEAGIDQSDILVVATDKDNVNIMIAQMAKVLFLVKEVIVRLYDADKKSIYEDMHIQTVSPTQLSQRALSKIINGGDLDAE